MVYWSSEFGLFSPQWTKYKVKGNKHQSTGSLRRCSLSFVVGVKKILKSTQRPYTNWFLFLWLTARWSPADHHSESYEYSFRLFLCHSQFHRWKVRDYSSKESKLKPFYHLLSCDPSQLQRSVGTRTLTSNRFPLIQTVKAFHVIQATLSGSSTN